jgi:AcrR family transcriptional regulator
MAEIDVPSNARSRRTRRALLDATRSVIEECGPGSVTMAEVADRAGVTRGAVYKHFDSVAALIGALFDHVAETEGLEESLERVWAAPDSMAALKAWADHLAGYHARVLAVDRALQRVDGGDRPVAEHRARVARAQLANCRRLAAWMAREGQLAAGWDVRSARDVLYGLTSSDVIERLLHDRRWTQRQLGSQLSQLLCSGLAGGDA